MTLLIVGSVALLAVVYLLDVWFFFNRPCRWCHGGKWRSRLVKDASRPCLRCGGSGRRRRWEWLRRG